MKIFAGTGAGRDLHNLRGLAECCGLDSTLAEIGPARPLSTLVAEHGHDDFTGAVFDVTSLAASRSPGQLVEFWRTLRALEGPILCLVREPGTAADLFLHYATEGRVTGATLSEPADEVTYPVEGGTFSKQLSGQRYRTNRREALGLSVPDRQNTTIVMSVGGRPSLVHVQVGRTQLYVWSTLQVLDVRKPLAAEREFEDASDQYIPLIIFVRAAFGERCWHNPRVGADLVIDDPLLTRSYGHIDFSRLLESAKAHKYHVTLAFIPWNHWRSRQSEVRRFLSYAEWFSICVHGCDHTRNEFVAKDYETLLWKSMLATERMERHEARTGMACDPIMVYPQERFSLEAMRALADSRRFLGVANTACIARNLDRPSVCSADLLAPAQDAFYGLPIFKRHYRDEVAGLAMGLFLGKPAILVEHHEFFENGTHDMERLVSQLAAIDRDVTWMSTRQIVTTTCLRRIRSPDRIEVRIFSDRFEFCHTQAQGAAYRLFRRVPADVVVDEVLVDGRRTSFSRQDDVLSMDIHVAEPGFVRVEVVCPPVAPRRRPSPGVRYQAAVAIRRMLSEIRDNVLSRNPAAMKAARSLMKSLKQTGG